MEVEKNCKSGAERLFFNRAEPVERNDYVKFAVYRI